MRRIPEKVWHNKLNKHVKVLEKNYKIEADEMSVIYTIELENGDIKLLARKDAGIELYHVDWSKIVTPVITDPIEQLRMINSVLNPFRGRGSNS